MLSLAWHRRDSEIKGHSILNLICIPLFLDGTQGKYGSQTLRSIPPRRTLICGKQASFCIIKDFVGIVGSVCRLMTTGRTKSSSWNLGMLALQMHCPVHPTDLSAEPGGVFTQVVSVQNSAEKPGDILVVEAGIAVQDHSRARPAGGLTEVSLALFICPAKYLYWRLM